MRHILQHGEHIRDVQDSMRCKDTTVSKEKGAEVTCTICSSVARVYYRHPDALIYECDKCSHVFTDPSAAHFHEIYTDKYFSDEHKNWFRYPDMRLWQRIVSQIPNCATSLLDVGCGKGAFLKFVQTQRPGLSLTGIDIACPVNAIEGITLIKDDFMSSQLPGTYDVVVSLATIEHVQDINGYLRRVRNVLRENGQFTVVTVNNRSALYRIARVVSKIGIQIATNRLYSLHHLHHFTHDSLRSVLQNNNFLITSHVSHNAPLRAMDIPAGNRLIRLALWAAVAIAFGFGRLIGACYQQTVVCSKVPDF